MNPKGPMGEPRQQSPAIDAPAKSSKQFVSYLVGFSVWVVVGAAPFLGTLDIPLFKPLLSLYPESLQPIAIPLSSFFMGVIAIVTEWYCHEYIEKGILRRVFMVTLLSLLATTAMLVSMYFTTVERINYDGGVESFVVAEERIIECACDKNESNSKCIQKLTLDETLFTQCWEEKQIKSNRLKLTSLYLIATSLFSLLVSLLVIRQRPRKTR